MSKSITAHRNIDKISLITATSSGYLQNPLIAAGVAVVTFLIFLCLTAPIIAPHDPMAQNINLALSPPSNQFPFGTDELGRCVLSRVIYGTRLSLLIGFAVTGITAAAGTLLGLIAGYAGGAIDEIIMRLVDILLAFPGLILALVISGILGPGLFNTILALSLAGWTRYARLARGITLSVKNIAFVEATRSLGGSHTYILFYHILPEIIAPVIVMATLGIGWTILMAASLSFLGLGAQPPLPEWGAMLNSGRNFLRVAPQLSIFPGIAIMLTVLAFNFLGDGLRDALDPRLKKQMEIK